MPPSARPPREDPDRVTRSHRLPDSARPTDGPFGPGNKKKQQARKFPKPPFSRYDPSSNPRPDSRASPRPDSRANDRTNARPGPPAKPGKNFGKVGTAHRAPTAPATASTLSPSAAAPSASPAASSPSTTSSASKTDWSDVAEWYDDLVGDEGSEFHQKVVLPGTLRLLGDVTGKNVLDIACGQGVLCRRLAELGASVTGTDSALPLLQAARERGPDSIPYLPTDATTLDGIPDTAFDLATCLLAIQNIQSPAAAFAAAARTLVPGGTFIIVMMHPAFRSPKACSWGWDASAESGVQFRRVDRYLLPRKEPIITHPGIPTTEEGGGQYTWTFHRPIGDYIKFLRQAGFVVDALEEWPSHKTSTSGPRAPAENKARNEIPMFLALRALKLAALPSNSPLCESKGED